MNSRHVTCVEPGHSLLIVAKKHFPRLQFIESTFEEFETQFQFDCVFAATAWHWVDPARGYTHASELLRESGHLAVMRNYHVESNPDAFLRQAQFIFAKYSKNEPDFMSNDQISKARTELDNEYFQLTHEFDHSWQETYAVDDYIALRNTYSAHRAMAGGTRAALENDLREFANEQFGGKVTQSYKAVLFVARKLA